MHKKPAINFIFQNPNSPGEFEEALKQILVDKLSARFQEPSV